MISGKTEDERTPMQSKTRPELSPVERKPLVDHGFITLERSGGGQRLVLADRAWAWAADAIDVEILKSRSTVGAEALEALLQRLLPFLKRRNLQLADLFPVLPGTVKVVDEARNAKPRRSRAKAEPAQSNERARARRAKSKAPKGKARVSTPEAAPSDELAGFRALPARIEEACLFLAGGSRKTRVRLSALRQALGSIERDALDDALLKLQDEGRLVLYRDDNTSALTDDDHRAALTVGGAPRHLVYLEA
jgi:hypothetical protein